MRDFMMNMNECDKVVSVKGCHISLSVGGRCDLAAIHAPYMDGEKIEAIQIGFPPFRAYLISYGDYVLKCRFSKFLQHKIKIDGKSARIIVCRDETEMIRQAIMCLRKNNFPVLYGPNGRKAVSYLLTRAESIYGIQEDYPYEFRQLRSMSVNSGNPIALWESNSTT